MAKLRIENNYGIAPNELLNSEELSFKAKGLFTYIQSKPDGWEFSVERIARQSKDGLDSVSSGLRELEQVGYLVRNKKRTPEGFWEIEYVLRINHSGKSSMVTIVENPRLDNPSLDNPPTKKERVRKKELVRKINPYVCFDTFWEEYPKKVNKQKAKVSFLSKKFTEPEFISMLDFIKQAKASEQWTKERGKFIPHATTFLNGARWEDDLSSYGVQQINRAEPNKYAHLTEQIQA